MARKNWRTCWWSYSKQCNHKKCGQCFFYLTILKGEIEAPNFDNFKTVALMNMVKEAFCNTNTNLNKIKYTPKKNPTLDQTSREKMLTLLKEVKRG